MTTSVREYWLKNCPSHGEFHMIARITKGMCLISREARTSPAYTGSVDEFFTEHEWCLWAIIDREQQLMLEIGLSELIDGVKAQ